MFITNSESHWITEAIKSDKRLDGRHRLDMRPVFVEEDIIPTCEGSAKITYSGTQIIIGVKAAIEAPDPLKPSEGCISFSVECSSTVFGEPLSGKGRKELAGELTNELEALYASSPCIFDFQKLCIIPKKYCWHLYVDIEVVCADGNIVDAIMLGIRTAFRSGRLPKTEIITEGRNGDEAPSEFEISSDIRDSVKFPISTFPISVTLSKIGTHLVADATMKEEMCSSSSITSLIDEFGCIYSIRKKGMGGFSVVALMKSLQVLFHFCLSNFKESVTLCKQNTHL